jgi:protein-disulfide isomerase
MLSAQGMAVADSDQLAQLRQEVSLLKQGQEGILKDLSAVLDILNGRTPPLDNVFIRTTESPSRGQQSAKVTIVEFTDFQCPFCGAYSRGTFGRILHDYVNTGTVRYIVRNFPLEQTHALARKAAEASLCAAEQGDFWVLHDTLFADQLHLQSILEHVPAIGANPAIFANCMESGKYAAKVAADLIEGQDLQIRATPTFFVGYTDSVDPSRIKAVRSIVGNAPYGEFQKAIAEALKVSQYGTGAG